MSNFVEEKDLNDGMTFDDMCDLWEYKTGDVALTKAPDGRFAVLDYTDLETYILQPKPDPKPAPAPQRAREPGL